MFSYRLDSDRFIHCVKTALACLIGFVITKSVHLYVDQWLIITIIVVMCAQINVGSMLQKSYMRFLGTLAGSMIAVLTLFCFDSNELALAVSISLSAMLFSYLATGEKYYSDAGTLGAVTVVIILINPVPTLFLAISRFIEITIGIIIAALISQFVLPIHARAHLRMTQAQTLKKLRAYYLAALLTDQTNETIESYQILDEDIAKFLIKQRKLAVDSSREFMGEKFYLYDFNQLLFAEKEILRAISAMQHAYIASPHIKMLFSNVAMLNHFHMGVCDVLEKIAKGIESQKIEKEIKLPDLSALKSYIFSEAKKEQEEVVVYLYVFLYAAEQMVKQLRQVLQLVSI